MPKRWNTYAPPMTPYAAPPTSTASRIPGLREHLLFYHKDLVRKRADKRERAKSGAKVRGALTGNGARHEPKAEQTEKYREALRLYRETAMTHRQIAEATGITVTGLRNHLRIWNRKLIVEHRGYECREGEAVDLSRTKQYLKSTAAKYAGAIACLKETGRPTAEVAKEFGLHPETFREYVREHEPELAARLGMTRLADGRQVLARSMEKYGEAVRLYETTTEPAPAPLPTGWDCSTTVWEASCAAAVPTP